VSKAKGEVHVAHLTSVHPPFDTRIFHKECRSLADAGYTVSLVVPHTHDELRDGVNVLAVPLAASRLKRMFLTPLTVAWKALKLRADVYQFHDPELIPVGLLLRLLGRKVVYDVHEDVPLDLLQKTYLPRRAAVLLSHVVRRLHWLADRALSGIVVVTPGVAESFRDPVMVRNFPLLHEFSEPGPKYEDRAEVAVYVGALGPVRGTRQMVDAARISARVDGRHLALAGVIRDDPHLQACLAADPPDDAIRYLGVLDRPEVRHLLGSARMGLFLSLPEDLNLYAAYPNKVFEYMAAGIPVVASDFPVLREIVGETGCGLLVDPTDVEAIAQAMDWLFDHPDEAGEMGRRGRELVLERYNFSGEVAELDRLYRRLCS